MSLETMLKELLEQGWEVSHLSFDGDQYDITVQKDGGELSHYHVNLNMLFVGVFEQINTLLDMQGRTV